MRVFVLRALALAALLVAMLFSPRAQAECAGTRWIAHPLTTLSTTFPRLGSAIVVAMEPDVTTGTLPTAELPPITLVRGRRTSHALSGVAIAPGLFRVPFVAQATRGIWTMHGLGADTTITIGIGVLPGIPVRPGVRVMRRVAATGITAGSAQRMEVRADLEFPVPEGTVASIVTWNADTAPSAWARATVGQTEIVVFSEPGRCASAPAGWMAPPDGPLTARISWVDRFGQISPASAAITVQ